jgi:hypothetical protein
MKPLIHGKDAQYVLDTTPDNERQLIIVGNHPDKYDDAQDARKICGCQNYDSMAINGAAEGRYFNYTATLHSAELGSAEFPIDAIHDASHVIGMACGCENERVDMTLAAEPCGGTSALFAVIAGLVLGYKSIYLCGVRLEPGTIYHDEHVEENWRLWAPLFNPALIVMGRTWLQDVVYNA